MRDWGYEMPSAERLLDVLFAAEPIEWNRIGAFQDVTMRLIAEQLLPERVRGTTYLRGELARLRPSLPRLQRGCCHVYCSPHNAGASALMREVGEMLREEVVASSTEMTRCRVMLVYLNGLTWTSGETSDRFADDVMQAMDASIPLLLVHEMPGAVGAVEERHSVAFDTFFACDDGATPAALINRSIYSSIAIALKGGEWRRVSAVMVAQGLGGESHGMARKLRRAAAAAVQGVVVPCRKRWRRPAVNPVEQQIEVSLSRGEAGSGSGSSLHHVELLAVDGQAQPSLSRSGTGSLRYERMEDD